MTPDAEVTFVATVQDGASPILDDLQKKLLPVACYVVRSPNGRELYGVCSSEQKAQAIIDSLASPAVIETVLIDAAVPAPTIFDIWLFPDGTIQVLQRADWGGPEGPPGFVGFRSVKDAQVPALEWRVKALTNAEAVTVARSAAENIHKAGAWGDEGKVLTLLGEREVIVRRKVCD